MSKTIRVLIKVRKANYLTEGAVDAYSFIGTIRGLEKAGFCISIGDIEMLSNKEYYVFEAEIEESCFERARGQANSYGVTIEKKEAIEE